MLVLGRHKGQEVLIHTDKGLVRVVVVGFNKYNGVRLGIEAPKEILILRKEVADRQSKGC